MQTESASSPLVVDAVGVRIGIDVDHLGDDDRHAVRTAWRDALSPERGSPAHTIVPDADVEAGVMLSRLSSDVTRSAIAARQGEQWMLHAAGLAAPDGGVIVLVGRSGAGKTTAVSVLARRWGYVSDEAIGIDDDGRVHAYRKPLSVITDGHVSKVQHAPDDLGLQPLPDGPLHLRRIVLLDRDHKHARARLLTVPLSVAFADLAPNSSALAAMPHPLRTMLRVVARTGGVLLAQYAEAADLEPLLDRLDSVLLSAENAAPAHAGGRVDHEGGEAVARPNPTSIYRRATVVDWCPVDDEQIAVLSAEADGRGVLRVLAGLAPAIWSAAADDIAVADLVRETTARFDEAPPADAVETAMVQLVEAGLLTVVLS
ncbi:hypothetical protein [Microbacterium sp. lyk4-40-TSB-66]|uniref:hypothetical protein n=1 Tax=Microbacterium sp. lyk4-40-TSB-66 TaxID=3040294 RepID=UPI00254B0246|nr:hypothetical protein [Microbacterium sp. lyk4-40-TSB-66]